LDSYQVAASPLAGPQGVDYDNETEANAFYTQFTWTPPVLDDKLALTLGYRRTEETKGVTYRYLTTAPRAAAACSAAAR
jgi:hypothetical protein